MKEALIKNAISLYNSVFSWELLTDKTTAAGDLFSMTISAIIFMSK